MNVCASVPLKPQRSAPGFASLFSSVMRIRSLDQCLLDGRNNFTLIRLLLAVLVLYSHAFALTGASNQGDFLWCLAGPGVDIGSAAVDGFFLISGILITRSYWLRQNLHEFLLARLARIYPANFACQLLMVFGVGAAFTQLELVDYLGDAATNRYLLKGLFLWSDQLGLPGVFEHLKNHFVNGSIWTLPRELRCYMLVGLLGGLGLLRQRRTANMALIVLAAIAFWDYRSLPFLGEMPFSGRLLTSFAIGAFLFVNAKFIPVGWPILVGAVMLYAGLFGGAFHSWMFGFVLGYGILVLAFCARLPNMDRLGDFSYGTYLYAFPVQQMLASVRPEWGAYQNMAAALPLTLALGVGSWHLIEKRAIRLARSSSGEV